MAVVVKDRVCRNAAPHFWVGPGHGTAPPAAWSGAGKQTVSTRRTAQTVRSAALISA